MHRQTLRTAWTGKPAVDRTVPYDHDRGADARKPGDHNGAIRITRAPMRDKLHRQSALRRADSGYTLLDLALAPAARWRTDRRWTARPRDHRTRPSHDHAVTRALTFTAGQHTHNLFPPATGRCVQTTTGSAPSSPAKGNAHDVPPWACCCLPASQEPDHVLSMVKALYEGGKVGGGNRPQRRTLVASCCV